jgi:hypothetical protein
MASKYMTGKDIIKQYKIAGFELFEYVRDGLKAYTKTKRIFNCPTRYNLKKKLDNLKNWIAKLEHPDFPKNLGKWDKDRVYYYDTPEILLREWKQDTIKYTKKMEQYEKKPGDRSWSWYYYDRPYSEKEEEKLINDIVKSYFLKDDVSKILPSNKKLRPSQKHRLACRDVAKVLWDKEPTLTIVAMSKRPEIIKACNGKRYVEKTIRRWIKEENPNSKPGRRKGS